MYPIRLFEEDDKIVLALMPATDSGIIILKNIQEEDEEVELWDKLNPLPLRDQPTGI